MNRITLSDPMNQLESGANLGKYKMAGNIVSRILDKLVDMCKDGARIIDICKIGDKLILEETDRVYKNIKNKGIAFPTCISINNVAGHCSSVEEEKEGLLRDGDLVKIELGVHIDGFPALIVYTVLINESKKNINDRRADVLRAAAEASKEIIKIMKPGKTNFDVVKIMEKYAKKYNCSLPVINENTPHAPGIISYQMSQYIIDGYNDDDDDFVHRMILARSNEEYEFSMKTMELEEDEVYAIDILMSSGNGNLNRKGKSTIFKRLQDKRVDLRTRTARNTLNSFNKERFPINCLNKDSRFKFGLKECIEKGIIEEYPIMEAKKDEFVSRVKFTVIVKKNPILITGRPSDEQLKKLNN